MNRLGVAVFPNPKLCYVIVLIQRYVLVAIFAPSLILYLWYVFWFNDLSQNNNRLRNWDTTHQRQCFVEVYIFRRLRYRLKMTSLLPSDQQGVVKSNIHTDLMLLSSLTDIWDVFWFFFFIFLPRIIINILKCVHKKNYIFGFSLIKNNLHCTQCWGEQ